MSESVWRIKLFKLLTLRKEMEGKLGERREAETPGGARRRREGEKGGGEEMSEKTDAADFSRKQRVRCCLRRGNHEEARGGGK